MNDRRSLIRNSVRSSERVLAAWITRILNIITGSNGGRPPCDAVRIGQRPRQLGPENLEIDRRRESQQLIAEIAQPLQPLVDVEKSRLPTHRSTPALPDASESDRNEIREVFGSAQLQKKSRLCQ